MQLNNSRLELIYEMIKDEQKHFACFGDVGTDHAHLPVFLLQQGLVGYAIASDVNTQPLKRAEENVRNFGYTDKVTLLLSDGLSKYSRECDVVCIAGLSGTTIVSILEDYLKNPWTKSPVFLLQPNTSISETRSFLNSNGFVFTDEQVCMDKRHEYPVIKGYFSEVKSNHEESVVFNHLGLFAERNDDITVKYLHTIYKKYSSVTEKLSGIGRRLNEREAALFSEFNQVIEFIKNKI